MANIDLISTADTDQAEMIVFRAAQDEFGRGRFKIYFDHGQWWVHVARKGHDPPRRIAEDIYEVVDVVGQTHGHGVQFKLLE